MAQEIIGFKIQVDGKEKIISSLGEMKKLLKDANFELLAAQKNFGDYSDQAKAAAKKVAELKDTIQEAKETSDLFDPGKKFQAFAGVASAVAGGFGAIQGAMNLVGIEGGNVEKALLKVQSAMALSQGLSSIADSGKDFKRLYSIVKDNIVVQKIYNFVMQTTAVTTTAVSTASKAAAIGMRILRGIMATIGIGALIIGVVMLIDKLKSWVGSTEDVKKVNEQLNFALEEQNRIIEKNRQKLQEAREDAILDAKIKGKSTEEIYAITKKYSEQEVADAQAVLAQKRKTLLEYQGRLEKHTNANGQILLRGSEEEIAQFNKLKEELTDAQNALHTSQRKGTQEVQNEQLRIAEDGRSKQQKINEKNAALSEKNIQDTIQAKADAAKRIQALEDEVYLQSITDETQRALVKLSQDRERDIIATNATKASKQQKAQELLLLDKKYEQDKKAIEDAAIEKKKEKEIKDAEEAMSKLRQVIEIERGIRIGGIQDEYKKKKAELDAQKEKEEEDLAKQRADTYFSEETYQQGLLNIKNKYIKAETELKKEEADKQKKIDEEKNTLTIESINKIATAFTSVTSEFGKRLDYEQQLLKSNYDKGLITQQQYNVESEKLAKKKAKQDRDLALFSLAIDTGVAIAGIVRLVSKNPMNLTGFAFAADLIARTGIVLANMAKARNAINQAKLSSASSGSNMSGGTSAAGGAAPMAPQLPQATITQLDQGSINRLGSASNRAYVVESDVTNSQERIRRINRAARLN